MKKLLLALLMLSYVGILFAQIPIYSRAKVYATPEQVRKIQALGVDLDHYSYVEKNALIGEFSDWEIQKMKDANISLEILIEDVTAFYANRNATLKGESILSTQNVPTGFNLGSMGGFLTYDEIVTELDSMIMMYPNLVSQKISIGTTLQGRNIYMVKISDNPNANENEPEILYNAMHHSREPQSMMQLFYFFYYILQNYGTNDEATHLINNRELYFIPVVNPDGYAYNELIAPSGGGMWRKNRKDNGDGTWGIDLNRNYSYQWGYNDIGSSPDGNSNLYRGIAPFSELETQAMRDLVLAHDFKIVLNYHTYGDLNIYPWGHKYEHTIDSVIFNGRGRAMKHENHYDTGPSALTLYEVNGEANDWLYGEQTTKPKIFGMTTEIGKTGFWPFISEIVPLSEENLKVNILNAWFAGEYVHCVTKDTFETNTATFQLPITCWNLGTEIVNNASIKVTAVNPSQVTSISGQQTINNLQLGNYSNYNFSVTLNPMSYYQKIPFKVEITLSDGTVIPFETNVYHGVYHTIYQDDFISTSATTWTSNSWGLTNQSYNSASYSFTDSPNALYAPNAVTTLTSPIIDLTNKSHAYLQFYYNNSVNLGDYVSVSVMDMNTSISTNVRGTSSVSINAEQGYALNTGMYVKEMIDLSVFENKKIKLIFALNTGDFQEDGFYLDDVLVRGMWNVTIPIENGVPYTTYYLFPNPTKGEVFLNKPIELEEGLVLEIIDIQGKRLYTKPLFSQTINIDTLVEGIYLYRFVGKSGISGWNKLVIDNN